VCSKTLGKGNVMSIVLGAQEDFEFRPPFLPLSKNFEYHISVNRIHLDAYHKYKSEYAKNENKKPDVFDFLKSDLGKLDKEVIKNMFASIKENGGKILIIDALCYGDSIEKNLCKVLFNAANESGLDREHLCYYHSGGPSILQKPGNPSSMELVSMKDKQSHRHHDLTEADTLDVFNHYTRFDLQP
jgi:hypothetical protein